MIKNDWFDQCSLQEKEALYLAEIENYSERMVIDRNRRIIFINRKFAAEFGKEPSEIEGLRLEEVFTGKNSPIILQLKDFDRPYIPEKDILSNKAEYKAIFCESPLHDDNGEYMGAVIYDGQDWLSRYQSLQIRLKSLLCEYKYLSVDNKIDSNLYHTAFIGESPAAIQLKKEILSAANTNATLLIEGETGTGKEIVATEVFLNSKRNNRPFVKINCAALPQELIESELFGYDEGAFTGAKRGGKKGLFEMANTGCILLDEISSLSLSAQVKLLRVLQEREVSRLGGEKIVSVNVRVIAISNRPLIDMVAEGSFREDLYYRLNVLYIFVPPLRNRSDDIPLLMRHFVQKCNEEMEKNVDTIDMQVYQYLKANSWPGNVRQLQNWVERAMSTAWKNVLTISNFKWYGHSSGTEDIKDTTDNLKFSVHSGRTLSQIMQEVEREQIIATLKRNNGNKTQTAKELGIARQLLYRKMKILSISE